MRKFLAILFTLAIVLSCAVLGIGTVATAAEASPEADFVVFDGVLEEYLGPGGDVVIPESLGVVEVASYAFANNEDINSIVFPEGVETIDYRACFQSSNISAVTLPYSLYELGGTAFSGCGITEVLIPGNCEVVPFGAFGNCPTSKVQFSWGVREIHTSSFSGGLCKTVVFPETVELICGFSFVFPIDSGKFEFVICNPDCEIGFTVQGIKENNEHSWDEKLCSIAYSAINKNQSISYVIPEGSSMREVIEKDMRDHLASTKGTSCDVSSNKLVIKEKPASYFEKLEENQEGFGVQAPKEEGSTDTDGGTDGGTDGTDGGNSGNSNGQNSNSQNGPQYVTQEADNGSTMLILGIVGAVVLLIIIGVVIFLVVYTKKPKTPQVMYMMGPDGKPVPVMMNQPVVVQPETPVEEAPVEEAPAEENPTEE